jgi:preprotein translocase subunit SecA
MDWDDVSDKTKGFFEGMGRGMMRLFGSQNERIIRRLAPVIRQIAELEPGVQALEQKAMQARVAELKAAVQSEEMPLDEALPEMFAMVREASVRTLGLRPFDVQLVGGYVLHWQPEGAKGCVAEMMTGEGKTLVATLPLALNALTGRKCFLVTVNDYLARRDADWMRPIYEYLGLSVGAVQSEMSPWDRKPIYACDIIYGTNNEFGFDYLRDNMKTRVEEQVQKDLYYAIVDEADSALIDEARTPLIISGPAEEHVGKYVQALEIVNQLEKDEHYEVKEKEKAASLLEDGIVRAQELLGVESFYVPGFEDWPHYLENALRAKELYQRDKAYVVEEGEVIIVDEFTGRKMNGRRWSDGLHQAVEVKEKLEPKTETQTLATITFQNYFRMFEKLAGMTGTALTEAAEFHKIYGMDVLSVPTNLPLTRSDQHDVIYRTEPEKWKAIVEEIAEVNQTGQPILVGTTSVEKSEHLSKLLGQRGIQHEVLNAKVGHWEREAKIVARAGEAGAVTVATNMAGRGTDIKLGGNFEYRLGLALEEAGLRQGDVEHLEEIDRIREEVRARCEKDEKAVLELGGLYVLGTERHEARRIDNQFRGRSGRQGNVGRSRFFLSLQDDLMRIFYRDWVTNAMQKLGMEEGVPIESGMVSRAIERAQKKVEERNFEIRKSLLEYDEVMNQQRKTIYGVRQAVLEKKGLSSRVQGMLQSAVERMTPVFVDDAKGFGEWCHKSFGFELPEDAVAEAVDREGSCESVFGPASSKRWTGAIACYCCRTAPAR